MKISVVIPALNEEKGIGDVVRRCRSFAHEIIVVDGGSTDRTVEFASAEGAQAIIEKMKGYGLALLTGFKAAKGDIIATVDADGTYPVESIPGMVRDLKFNGLCFITCCRFPLLEPESMSRRNRFGNWVLSLIGSLLFMRRFNDVLSGMWIFRRSILSELSLYSTGWDLSQEIKVEASKFGCFAERLIRYSERVGESKLQPWRVGWSNLCYFVIHRLGLRHLFGQRFDFDRDDNWDRHWSEIAEASEEGPTPNYRAGIIYRELGLKDDSRLLNVGCGCGGLEAWLCEKTKARLYGIDTSETAIALAKMRIFSNAHQVTFNEVDLGSFIDRNLIWIYDPTHVVVSEVLEHLDRPDEMLRHVADTVSPGTRVVITVPGGPMNEFYQRIGHRRHYTPRQLRDLVLSTGQFEVHEAYGCGWPFFNIFRICLTLFGNKVNAMVNRRPSLATRVALKMFGWLFRFNLSGSGWQTVVIAVRNKS